jgi:hypothetical protein
MCWSRAIPQIMGPTDSSDMSSTPLLNQILTVLNLIVDGSNWSTYSERVMNYLTSKGLKRHVQGTVCRPADLIERNGEYYRRGTLSPLNDEELEKTRRNRMNMNKSRLLFTKFFTGLLINQHLFR